MQYKGCRRESGILQEYKPLSNRDSRGSGRQWRGTDPSSSVRWAEMEGWVWIQACPSVCTWKMKSVREDHHQCVMKYWGFEERGKVGKIPIVISANSLEKTLMLGKIEGRRRRGWQRMSWLDGITNAINLSKLKEIMRDREAWHAVVFWGLEESETTWQLNNSKSYFRSWKGIITYMSSVDWPFEMCLMNLKWNGPTQLCLLSFLWLVVWLLAMGR